MKYLLAFVLACYTVACQANDPSRPLIKRDTISYIQCYFIDTLSGGTTAPYTFFKIGKNNYEGAGFPFSNYCCIENHSASRDSFKYDYERTVDTAGEEMIAKEALRQGAGDRYDRLPVQNFDQIVTCLTREKFPKTAVLQFVQVRFIARYYVIRCEKNRGCNGPDIFCFHDVDAYRAPVFVNIERLLR